MFKAAYQQISPRFSYDKLKQNTVKTTFLASRPILTKLLGFHSLSEFDEGKRSCRKRLADHNRRRRKPQVQPNSSASGSPPAEPTAPKNENPESAVRSIHSNGDQAEVQNGLDQHPTLLSAGQSAPSVPHTAQNEKKPSSVLSPTNEKEAYQQYLRGGRSSPGLSLSTLGSGAGGMGAPQQQSSSQVFESVDIPVPWLRSLSAKQNLIEAVAKPSISIPHIASDAGSPNRQFVELTTGGSSATMQALPHSLQNLLPLTASVRDHTGSSNSLVMKNMSLQSHEHLGKFSSPNLNLQAKAEEQEVLSLLDVREVRAAENQNQQRVQPPPLEIFHHQLSTTMKLSESVDTQAAPVNGDVKFPGLQALRPFNHSIFNNRENIL